MEANSWIDINHKQFYCQDKEIEEDTWIEKEGKKMILLAENVTANIEYLTKLPSHSLKLRREFRKLSDIDQYAEFTSISTLHQKV